MFVSVPIFNLKGRQLICDCKSKSVAFISGLGPKDGFSLEVGGVISDGVASTCSNLPLIVLGAIGEKDILILPLPLYAGPMLYFINLVHDK